MLIHWNETRWVAAATLTAILTVAFGFEAFEASGQREQPTASDDTLPTPTNADNTTQPSITDPRSVADSRNDLSVLEEGPIHEAFAEPLSSNLDKGIVVDRQPPEPIDEIPPGYRPEGKNVEWIPGYWMWLQDRNDFVWVSGVWRSIPPGRVWTPGHWSSGSDGYRWISGFWSDIESQQIEYLPYPPESLEQGPSSPSPSDQHFWVPGSWRWESDSYVWRPGYWYPGQPNWLWVPHHYAYTPRGAVFVRGYWDYPVQLRGLLYAPVYWPGGYNYGYSYTPSQVVNTALLLSALFIDRDRGYYYYGPGYRGRGNFYPWYAGYGRGVYSPLYSFYSWQLGRESDSWQDRFDVRRQNGRGGDRNFDGPQPSLVGTVEDVRRSIEQDDSRNGDPRSRFQQLTEAEREASRERARNMDQFRSARARFEAENNNVRDRLENIRGQGQNRAREARVNVPKSYQPPTFDLQTAEGAAQLRRQAQARFEQRVVRQNGDESRSDNRVERRPRDVQGGNDARLPGARGSRQPNRTEQFNRPSVRSNQQPPAAPRDPQIEQRGNRQGEANNGSSSAGGAERSRGIGNGNGGNASQRGGNSKEKSNRGGAGGGGNKTGGGNRGGGGKGK